MFHPEVLKIVAIVVIPCGIWFRSSSVFEEKVPRFTNVQPIIINDIDCRNRPPDTVLKEDHPLLVVSRRIKYEVKCEGDSSYDPFSLVN